MAASARYYDDQWVLLPSLTAGDVKRVDQAGANAIHDPSSPTLTRSHSVDAPERFLGTVTFTVPVRAQKFNE